MRKYHWLGLAVGLVVAALCCLIPLSVQAVTAYPGEIEFTEEVTDSTIRGYQYGDEFFSYIGDTEGNVLLKDHDGRYRYVVAQGDSFCLGGAVTDGAAPDANAVTVSQVDESFEQKLTDLRKQEEQKETPSLAKKIRTLDLP